MAKSKGVDSPVKEKKTDEVSELLNMGEHVTLSIGKYHVRQVSFFELAEILAEAANVFSSLATGEQTMAFLGTLARDPEVKRIVCWIFSKFCREPDITKFEKDLSPEDGLKLIVAIKRVANFEEIQKSFLELGLDKVIPRISMAN